PCPCRCAGFRRGVAAGRTWRSPALLPIAESDGSGDATLAAYRPHGATGLRSCAWRRVCRRIIAPYAHRKHQMSAIELDLTDLMLLAELQRAGRQTNAELAERVHLSASACLRRVQRL